MDVCVSFRCRRLVSVEIGTGSRVPVFVGVRNQSEDIEVNHVSLEKVLDGRQKTTGDPRKVNRDLFLCLYCFWC